MTLKVIFKCTECGIEAKFREVTVCENKVEKPAVAVKEYIKTEDGMRTLINGKVSCTCGGFMQLSRFCEE